MLRPYPFQGLFFVNPLYISDGGVPVRLMTQFFLYRQVAFVFRIHLQSENLPFIEEKTGDGLLRSIKTEGKT